MPSPQTGQSRFNPEGVRRRGTAEGRRPSDVDLSLILGSYLEIADVGISPQPNNEHWNNSIPHKLFEYMSQSKPVLVTDAIPLKRIILETKAGLYYRSGDPESFADKILEIASSKTEFGANGLKAVNEKYNWKNDAKVLINMYEGL